MDKRERAALRAKTESKPVDTFVGARYDGRVAKAEYKARTQIDHKVHEKSCF